MKNIEIKKLFEDLTALEQYCDTHDIRNSGINKIIIYNLKRLSSANEVIKKSAPKELIELENKLFEDAKDAYFSLSLEEQKITVPFLFALSKASQEVKNRRDQLLIPYNELLEEENEVHLYILEDPTRIDQVDLSPKYQRIINNFLPENY